LSKKTEIWPFLKYHKIDILFTIFFVAFSVYLYSHVSNVVVPPSDAADYLLNARNWLSNTPLEGGTYPTTRAPLISWIIAGVWMIIGENWIIINYLMPIFTLGAGILLYMVLRKRKGSLFAFGVSALTMLNPQVFFWSTHILTESLSLFFLILSLYFLKSEKESHWLLAGIAIGLTFASRYPIFIQSLTILVVEVIIRKNPRLAIRTIMTAIPVIIIVVLVVVIKTGTFAGASEPNSHFTFLLTPFYLENSIYIWGYAFFLVPIAFLFKKTYSDPYNYTFIAWFIVSLIFWSAHSMVHLPRYTVHYSPAIYYLAILAIENIRNINITKESLYGVVKRFSTK
jgi:4-amino-4-deoxy-L-arabinose transferase-like glycosyltransferase